MFKSAIMNENRFTSFSHPELKQHNGKFTDVNSEQILATVKNICSFLDDKAILSVNQTLEKYPVSIDELYESLNLDQEKIKTLR